MKIIKQGKLPEDKTYSGECNHCECEFEFQAKEAKYTTDQRDGDFYSIACPTCRRPVCVAV